jgi:hypothetical protein
MKNISGGLFMNKFVVIIFIFLYCTSSIIYSQEIRKQKSFPDNPTFFSPKKHEPNFKLLKKLPAKSFYDSKPEWQHIIDSTWGPGDSLSQKLLIFNTYAKQVHDKFDGFNSLHLNWDSLYNFYLNKITDSTSRGAFSAIMSHFAYSLKDIHTIAYDSSVVYTPLYPGVPILLLGSYITVEHFGAVTTVLPDSTTLVLRVVPNHPLGIEPGDIILGYEGIPWKALVQELLGANLPVVAVTGGCKTADTYLNLFGAGINWHLFNTIDILKHSTGETVHFSVLPLLDLNAPPMANNEQLSIPNIPFPNVLSDQCVTYGVLENTNIGYIYLSQEWPENTADAPFYKAVDSLKNTNALIIDMRLNYGGWGVFDDAFKMLFNQSYQTIEDLYRCSSNNFALCPSGNQDLYKINGSAPDFYDRPIAVLLGPTCVSMGDLTAQRLRYHPMIRFFGASSDASLGDNLFITSFPGWYIRNSISDMFHTDNPGVYLNRREFPIDFPVWFNKDNVANGKDDAVEKALEWINNLVYGHDLTKNSSYCHPGIDTLKISALVENPNSHQTSSKIYIKNLDGSFIDSLELVKTGLSGKPEIWTGNYLAPDSEDIFSISLSAKDITESKTWTTDNITHFTTAGPVTVDSVTTSFLSNLCYIRPFVHNLGKTATIKNASVKFNIKDPWVLSYSSNGISLPDIAPGLTIGASSVCIVSTVDSIFPGYFNIKFEIVKDGWTYWRDSIKLIISPVGIDNENNLPLTFNLEQNYPNPFNPSTSIQYAIGSRQFVTLKIYNVLGQEIETLVNEEKATGIYEVKFNAKDLTSGVYFYKLKATPIGGQAGEFIQTKKMILLK